MKIKSFIAIFSAIFAVSCVSSEKKSIELEYNLPSSCQVIAANYDGTNHEIVVRERKYSEEKQDSVYVVTIHSLVNDKVDTLFRSMGQGLEPIEVHKHNGTYIAVLQECVSEDLRLNAYSPVIVKNYNNPQLRTAKLLYVLEDQPELDALSCMVNTHDGYITLTSYQDMEDRVLYYRSIYNLDGELIMTDPTYIPKGTSQHNSSYNQQQEPLYLWECRYCGYRCNGGEKISWLGDCPQTQRATGIGGTHSMIKINRLR